jgi:hypothetical protein
MEKPISGWTIFQEAPGFLKDSAVQPLTSSSIASLEQQSGVPVKHQDRFL